MNTLPIAQIVRMLSVPLFSLLPIADAADSRSVSPSCVFWRHFMTVWAMRLPVKLFVFFSGERLKMVGIAAKLIWAFVMKVKAFWNHVPKSPVNEVVNEVLVILIPQSSIASNVFFPSPKPALVFNADFAGDVFR